MILFVNACIRPDSRTLTLAESVLQNLNGEIETLDLNTVLILPLDWESLCKRENCIAEDPDAAELIKYAKQFAEADEIVIAAPYWDLSFPAILKCYIEAITVVGTTFEYTPQGYPKGLCRAKRLIFVTTAGGVVLEKYNLGFDYIKNLCQLYYGIDDVLCCSAEGLDILGADVDEIMKNAIKKIPEILK